MKFGSVRGPAVPQLFC